MYYQSYEDYIRSILGYPVLTNSSYPNITYDYSDNYEFNTNIMPRYSNEILDLYPEIYKIINPMVCKICEANTKPITRELLEQMTDEIYLNIEGNANLDEDTVNVKVTVPSGKNNSRENANSLNSSSSGKSNLTQSPSKQNRSSSSVVNNLTQSRTSETRLRQTERQEISTTQPEKQANSSIIRQQERQLRQSVAQEPRIENLQVKEEKQSRQKENEIAVPQTRQFRRNPTLRDLIKILILNQLLGGRRPPHRPGRPRPPFPGEPGQGPRPNPRPPMNPRDYGLM